MTPYRQKETILEKLAENRKGILDKIQEIIV